MKFLIYSKEIEYSNTEGGFIIHSRFKDAFLLYLREWVDPVSERWPL